MTSRNLKFDKQAKIVRLEGSVGTALFLSNAASAAFIVIFLFKAVVGGAERAFDHRYALLFAAGASFSLMCFEFTLKAYCHFDMNEWLLKYPNVSMVVASYFRQPGTLFACFSFVTGILVYNRSALSVPLLAASFALAVAIVVSAAPRMHDAWNNGGAESD